MDFATGPDRTTEHALRTFGPSRCLVASNAPIPAEPPACAVLPPPSSET